MKFKVNDKVILTNKENPHYHQGVKGQVGTITDVTVFDDGPDYFIQWPNVGTALDYGEEEIALAEDPYLERRSEQI